MVKQTPLKKKKKIFPIEMVKEMNNKKMRFVADNDPKVIKIVEGCAE